jgi:hypothetical protein
MYININFSLSLQMTYNALRRPHKVSGLESPLNLMQRANFYPSLGELEKSALIVYDAIKAREGVIRIKLG